MKSFSLRGLLISAVALAARPSARTVQPNRLDSKTLHVQAVISRGGGQRAEQESERCGGATFLWFVRAMRWTQVLKVQYATATFNVDFKKYK